VGAALEREPQKKRSASFRVIAKKIPLPRQGDFRTLCSNSGTLRMPAQPEKAEKDMTVVISFSAKIRERG
jgi:hypothetical protein